MEHIHVHALDYVSVLHRRKWWLIVPSVLSVLVGLALVRYLPKEYRSTATLGVAAPIVSPNLVNQLTPLDNQERMAAARKGVETLQRALKLKPDYFEAMSYMSLLLRQEARFTSDGQQQKALTDQADQWRAKGLEELKKRRTQQP